MAWPVVAAMVIGVDEQEILFLQLGLDGVERGLKSGPVALAGNRHPVSGVVARPDGLHAILSVKSTVVAKHVDIILRKRVAIHQGSIKKFHVIDMPLVRHSREQDRVARAIRKDNGALKRR